MLGVTILGNNSALPAFDRHPTAQVVIMEDQLFLIDCGEGTQVQLTKYKVRRSKIQHIFISHLHGDHYFGLIGLLTSMALLGRTQDIHLFAPAPLKPILDMQFAVADTTLPYNLIFHPLNESEVIWQEEKIKISCFKVSHRIDCWGFRFDQVRAPRKINLESVKKFAIPTDYYEKLQWGEDYLMPSGEVLKNELLTEAAPKPKSYAYSSDTLFDERVIEKVYGVDVLYHETTYLKGLEEKAAMRFHCTTTQAATVAQRANVNKLLIGHFSSKYETLEQFEAEAKEVFPNTFLAEEGVTYKF